MFSQKTLAQAYWVSVVFGSVALVTVLELGGSNTLVFITFSILTFIIVIINLIDMMEVYNNEKAAHPDEQPQSTDALPMINIPEDRSRDNFEAVYEISHTEQSGFGGNTTIRLAVEEETDTEITGRKFDSTAEYPDQAITTIQKSNVVGWTELPTEYQRIPTGDPDLTEQEVTDLYAAGEIDEEEMDELMEKAIIEEKPEA